MHKKKQKIHDGLFPVPRHLTAHPQLVRRRRVLELGSGCGLCGILAAKMGAAEVHCPFV